MCTNFRINTCCSLQCGLVMKLHMLNPATTRELTAAKLEDSPDAPGELETSEHWLNMAVRDFRAVSGFGCSTCVWVQAPVWGQGPAWGALCHSGS